MDNTPEVLKVREAADLLRCSTAWLYREAAAGRVPSYRIGTDYRFIREDLLSWLRRQTSRPAPIAEVGSDPSHQHLPLPQVNVQEPVPTVVQEAVQEAVQDRQEVGDYYDPTLRQDAPLEPCGRGPRLSDQQRRERQVWVVTAVRRGATLASAASLAGLGRRTLSLWQCQHPDFDRAVKEAARAAKETPTV